MKKFSLHIFFTLLAAVSISNLSGCAMGNTSIAQEDAASIASKIIPGKTTQSEVLQIYGQPMYRQANGDGTETWTYSTMDTSFKTYVPFAPLVTGNDGTQGKDLSIKFSRTKIVISQDFTQINNNTPAAETKNIDTKLQKSAEQPPSRSKANSGNSAAKNSIHKNDLIGIYENRSESEFIFTFELKKNGSATYLEPNAETGKTLKSNGRWKQEGSNLNISFGKSVNYQYTIQTNLSWADFGCKGGSFGLKNESIPKSKTRSVVHDVWRKSDLKKADACQPL